MQTYGIKKPNGAFKILNCDIKILKSLFQNSEYVISKLEILYNGIKILNRKIIIQTCDMNYQKCDTKM